jgi:hypothetical protein
MKLEDTIWLLHLFPVDWEHWEAKLIQRFQDRIFKIIGVTQNSELILNYFEIMKSLKDERLDIEINTEFSGQKVSWLRITFPQMYDAPNKVSLIEDQKEYSVYEAEYIEWEQVNKLDNEIYELIWTYIQELLHNKYGISVDMELASVSFDRNKFQIWSPNIKGWIVQNNEKWEKILHLIITDIARSIYQMPINRNAGEAPEIKFKSM